MSAGWHGWQSVPGRRGGPGLGRTDSVQVEIPVCGQWLFPGKLGQVSRAPKWRICARVAPSLLDRRRANIRREATTPGSEQIVTFRNQAAFPND
jgi:hypothetical protein